LGWGHPRDGIPSGAVGRGDPAGAVGRCPAGAVAHTRDKQSMARCHDMREKSGGIINGGKEMSSTTVRRRGHAPGLQNRRRGASLTPPNLSNTVYNTGDHTAKYITPAS